MRRNIHLIKTIGTELRGIRTSKNLQLKEVAEVIGVSSTYISEIERNHKVPSNELIEKIAAIYGINEQHLLKGFKVIPDSMIYELTSESGLYDILYELSENEKITREEKDSFYNKIEYLFKIHSRKSEYFLSCDTVLTQSV
ncbi:MAG: helix-turn-helix domain-containing protein [Bacillus sp. (in: firmicutes)]